MRPTPGRTSPAHLAHPPPPIRPPPQVTLPLERFASRVAASLCNATGLGAEMVVGSQQEYEDRVSEEQWLALPSHWSWMADGRLGGGLAAFEQGPGEEQRLVGLPQPGCGLPPSLHSVCLQTAVPPVNLPQRKVSRVYPPHGVQQLPLVLPHMAAASSSHDFLSTITGCGAGAGRRQARLAACPPAGRPRLMPPV